MAKDRTSLQITDNLKYWFKASSPMVKFTLTSKAFPEGQFIPVRCTCQGQDVSPPLEWQGVPEGTKEFALECFDPDAPGGGFVHWVLYKIPGSVRAIEEGKIPKGSKEGANDFGKRGYGGPCPPRGPPHRYVFTIYALDKTLGEIETLDDLKREIRGHVLAEAKLTGLYQRK
jgi:hypothetical protein